MAPQPIALQPRQWHHSRWYDNHANGTTATGTTTTPMEPQLIAPQPLVQQPRQCQPQPLAPQLQQSKPATKTLGKFVCPTTSFHRSGSKEFCDDHFSRARLPPGMAMAKINF